LLRAERKQPDKRIGSCTAGSSVLEFSNVLRKPWADLKEESQKGSVRRVSTRKWDRDW
jgi:hypothetical protein